MLAITGSSGLIGRYLCDSLISRDIPFKILGRNLPNINGLTPDRIFPFDLSQELDESLYSFLTGVDVVIHLAALMPSPGNEIIDYYLCNSVAPKSLLDICIQSGVRQYIYMSGSNFMQPVNGLVTGDSPYSLSLRHPPYLTSKMAGELMILNTPSPSILTIVRPSSVYGHGIRNGLFRNIYDSFINQLPVSLSNEGLWSADFIYAGDIARVILHLINTSMPGVFNIGSGISRTSLDVAQTFANLLSVDHDLIHCRPSDPGLASVGSLPIVSSDQFEALLGHLPLSLEQGLDHAFQQYGGL